MDFVNRLKHFMDGENISSSQFADSCRIPRPTMSQILNGRNKKISDELIAKIHSAYPQLSVLWLMFGEGDMTLNSNTQISGPKKDDFTIDPQSQTTEGQHIDNANRKSSNAQDLGSDNSNHINSLFDDTGSTLKPYLRPDEQPSHPDNINERQQFYMHTHELIEFDDSPVHPSANANSKSTDTTPSKTSNAVVSSESSKPEEGKLNISIAANANKRITNIVVFYSDNSFQSFNPS